MKSVLLAFLIVLRFGISSAIRAKLKKRDVQYIAEQYTAAGEPGEFEYFSSQVEMVAVDARRRLIYAIGDMRLSVLKILRNKTLQLLHTETFETFVLESIQTCKGLVTVAARNDQTEDDDRLFVFRGYRPWTGDLQKIHAIPIRHGPHDHAVSHDCRRIIVALRGAGNLAVINFKDARLWNPTVTTLSFNRFANDIERLQKEWFLLTDPKESDNFDELVDPRWICLNKLETKAYVSLPRNNGIAVVDLRPGREHVRRLGGLGLKSWAKNDGTQGLDGSRTPQQAELKNAPIFSTYNPNQLSCQTIRKQDYIFIAGEGSVVSTGLLSGIPLDEDENFPADLTSSEEFGDLRVLPLDSQTDKDGDDRLNKIVTPGSRSFAAFSGKKLTVLADTGSSLELKTMNTPLFNADPSDTNTLQDDFDRTSTFRGPEPELVITKKICRGRYVVLVGAAANPGHLFVYTLDTNHLENGFVFQDRIDGYLRQDSFLKDIELYTKRLLSLRAPKSLAFASGHYNGGNLMVVSGSRGSSTVGLFDLDIDCRAMTPKDNPPE